MDFSQDVKPICMPYWTMKNYNNDKATIAGWGPGIEKASQRWNLNLKEHNTTIWTGEFCRGVMKHNYQGKEPFHIITK